MGSAGNKERAESPFFLGHLPVVSLLHINHIHLFVILHDLQKEIFCNRKGSKEYLIYKLQYTPFSPAPHPLCTAHNRDRYRRSRDSTSNFLPIIFLSKKMCAK